MMNTERLVCILRNEASKCDQSDYKHQAAARLEEITAQLSASEQRVKFVESVNAKQEQFVCNTLGKALGFPTDPEGEGICCGDEVLESLCEMSVKRISNLEQRVKALEKFEQQMKTLRELCVYVEDGSSDSVTLSQDDATGTWHITVGYSPRSRKSFWDESFDGVFLKAKSYVESNE